MTSELGIPMERVTAFQAAMLTTPESACPNPGLAMTPPAPERTGGVLFEQTVKRMNRRIVSDREKRIIFAPNQQTLK